MMRERHSFKYVAWRACAVVMLILCTSLAAGRPPSVEDPAGPTEPFPAQLTILFSGELNGKLEPISCPTCGGGLARRHALVRSIRFEQNPVVLLECGDVVQEVGAESELKFQTALLAMNEMGYDALNIGEFDVALGPRFLTNMAQRARFPLISANVADSNGQRFFPAYTMIERVIGGKRLRVAVLGVLSDRTADYLAKQQQVEVTVLNADQAVATTLDRLKGKADVRILLAHAGAEEALSLARKHRELDLVIYSHEANLPAENEGSTEEQIVANAGGEGEHIARLDVSLDESLRRLSHSFSSLMLSDLVPDSPDVRAMLDSSMRLAIDRGFGVSESVKQPVRGGYYVGTNLCAGCHEEAYRVWSESRHAKAFAPLRNKKRQSDARCLRCHATGYGFFTGFESEEDTPELANVGCEACHGVGSNHGSNPTTRYGRTSRGNCKSCHDKLNSPRFNYSTYYKKIAHEAPKEQKGEEKPGEESS